MLYRHRTGSSTLRVRDLGCNPKNTQGTPGLPQPNGQEDSQYDAQKTKGQQVGLPTHREST
jgi:hypothetical protein